MKPMLFNADMVRAILEGRKTVTRRVMRPQPPDYFVPCPICPWWSKIWIDGIGNVKLPVQIGDVLYVRETWKQATIDPAGGGYGLQDIYLYKADEPIDTTGMLVEDRWHPSIHMPKEAARIYLRVEDVRVERLGDISADSPGPENQVVREGFRFESDFIATWNSTVKPADLDKFGWDANPWVWVIEFERIGREETGNDR